MFSSLECVCVSGSCPISMQTCFQFPRPFFSWILCNILHSFFIQRSPFWLIFYSKINNDGSSKCKKSTIIKWEYPCKSKYSSFYSLHYHLQNQLQSRYTSTFNCWNHSKKNSHNFSKIPVSHLDTDDRLLTSSESESELQLLIIHQNTTCRLIFSVYWSLYMWYTNRIW